MMRWLLVLFTLILIPVAATANPSTASAATVTNVLVDNLTYQSFSVTWNTGQYASGMHIEYGTTCTGATTSGPTESNTDGYVHLASTSNSLAASKTYFFVIVESNGTIDTANGNCWSVTTLPASTLGHADEVHGTVTVATACSVGLAGARMTAIVSRGSGASLTTSYPLGVMTSSGGSWLIVVGGARVKPSGALMNTKSGDAVQLTATSANNQSATETVTYNGSGSMQVQNLCVAAPPTAPTSTPTVTGTPPTATPTSVPTCDATVYICDTPTDTPTPTATCDTAFNSCDTPSPTATCDVSIYSCDTPSPTATCDTSAAICDTPTPTCDSTVYVCYTPTSTPVTGAGCDATIYVCATLTPTCDTSVYQCFASTDTPTPVGTDDPTSTDFPTNTDVPTDTPGPSPTDTPTDTPVATDTPLPTDTPLVTDTPTPSPDPLVASGLHIHIKAFLTQKVVPRGERQTVFVSTDPKARIHLIVIYSDNSTAYEGYGNPQDGFWSRHWKVTAKHPGIGTAKLAITEKNHTRFYSLKFQIR